MYEYICVCNEEDEDDDVVSFLFWRKAGDGEQNLYSIARLHNVRSLGGAGGDVARTSGR